MLEKMTTKSMLDCQREAKTHSVLHSLNYFMYHVLFHAIRDLYHFNCGSLGWKVSQNMTC